MAKAKGKPPMVPGSKTGPRFKRGVGVGKPASIPAPVKSGKIKGGY